MSGSKLRCPLPIPYLSDLKLATETLLYLALSALIFSSQGIAPQNGARMMLELSRQRQNSWKSSHVAVLFSSSLCALHADRT